MSCLPQAVMPDWPGLTDARAHECKGPWSVQGYWLGLRVGLCLFGRIGKRLIFGHGKPICAGVHQVVV